MLSTFATSMGLKDVSFSTLKGQERMCGRLSVPRVEGGEKRPAFLFCGDWNWAEPREMWGDLPMQVWAETNFTLTFDYRATWLLGTHHQHGMTPNAYLNDAAAAADFLLQQPGVDKDKFTIVGVGLGANMAICLTRRHQVSDLMLADVALYPDDQLDERLSLMNREALEEFRQRCDPERCQALLNLFNYRGRLFIMDYANCEGVMKKCLRLLSDLCPRTPFYLPFDKWTVDQSTMLSEFRKNVLTWVAGAE